MAKNKKKRAKNRNNNHGALNREPKPNFFPKRIKYSIYAILFFLIGVILALSFFDKSGIAGQKLNKFLFLLMGKIAFLLPLLFLIGGLIFINSKLRKKGLVFLGMFLMIIGLCAVLGFSNSEEMRGGWLGAISLPFLKFFGSIVSNIIFLTIIFIGLLIIFQELQREKILFPKLFKKEEQKITQNSQIVKNLKPEKKEIIKEKKNISRIFSISRFQKEKTEEKDLELPKDKFLPPLTLLNNDQGKPIAQDVKKNSEIIQKTLENFGIPIEMGEVNIGSTITQYTLRPAEGIRLSKITALDRNISLALAAHPIRIEAPIPGKALIGIEVPNKSRSLVRLKNLIANSLFQKSSSFLIFCLGRDVIGRPIYADLSEMPHLLVAGATGTGKTIFLNSFLLSLLYKNSPQTLRLILVDPKRVEFSTYNDIPHLLCPVIYRPKEVLNILSWLIGEMERRFIQLAEKGVRNIANYNKKSPSDFLPYIVLVIDELADLMANRGREIEVGIVRLAQLARAVGIHLVLATQRPSVEVLTGLIKANITSRVAFQVASQIDARTILDMAGAEKLLGLGDMLFVSAKNPKPKRIQGPYVSETEVKKVGDFIRENAKFKEDPYQELIESLKEELKMPPLSSEQFYNSQGDSLYEEAKKVVIKSRKASASLLQRRLKIGYARAARLIDILEEKGIVGSLKGAKPREVYLNDNDIDDTTDGASGNFEDERV